ncbi:MAG TPA: VWA domain-containing protein [Pyrinomonadaceae bacterium]|jgi:VWFA-related protein
MLWKSRKRFVSSFAIAFLCVSLLSPTRAQEIDPNDIIRVNTDLVILDAQVIDKKTRKVFGGLRQRDFEIYEENVKQPIVYFSQDQLPLSVLLLLDISRSVAPIIEQVGAGANDALQRLKPEDEVAVMAFADYPKLIQPFTKDRSVAADKITEASRTFLGHGTYMVEALHQAEQQMNNAGNPTNRRAIIVVTDNIAVSGRKFGTDKVINDLLESGTVVYGLVVRAAFGKVFNILSLGTIHGVDSYCEETGGEVLGADRKEVASRLGEMFTRLRTRYTLGYRPPETNEEGAFRRVKVQLSPEILKVNKKLVVRARHGYYFRKRARTIS